MLNEYFAEMVETIFVRGGMLDKYLGDGLMAIFGAPIEGSLDADNALLVATDMMRALEGLMRVARSAGWRRWRSVSGLPPARCWPAPSVR
jgi:adenylate cyclase